MIPQLKIKLFGGLVIEKGSQPVTALPTRKAELLLAYLALHQRPHSREVLATLLWDDRTQEQALSNLRTLLTALRRSLKPYLAITRQTVALKPEANVWVDVAAFESLLDREASGIQEGDVTQFEEALALYQGDFLEGVFIRDSRGLEEWIAATRERLRGHALRTRQYLAGHYLYYRRYREGIQNAQAIVVLDPLLENGWRVLMRLLARDGQRNAALAQYGKCRRILDQELGVEPAPETTALYERILQAKLPPPFEVPAQFTPFIGRQAELATIGRQLDDPDCRLLTLTGPGGVGKTRLALQIAADRRGEYLNGVFFVPLAAADSAEALPSTLANALGLPTQGKNAPKEQLLEYLAEKELLLILDNFEHLIEHGVDFVQAILEAAPEVQLLVTSRERLYLRAEWLRTIEGLSFSTPEVKAGEGFSEAALLFQACARRTQPHFELSETSAAVVADICRLVDGLPLGIELAAASLPDHKPEKIMAEIRQNLDFLATRMRDMPARHRSLQAAFEHSWKLLPAHEQGVLSQLSLFRGGFNHPAAASVSGATEPLLQSFVAKSLVRQLEGGRYELHELLRQFAAEKLAESPAEEREAHSRHSDYYSAFLAEKETELEQAQAAEAIKRVMAEIDNIRLAWNWAVDQANLANLSRSLEALSRYFQAHGPFQEAEALLSAAAQRLQAMTDEDDMDYQAVQSIIPRLLAWQASFLNRLDRHDQALITAQQTIESAQQANASRQEVEGYLQWGQALQRRGESESARKQYHIAIQLAQENGFSDLQGHAYYDLATGLMAHGEHWKAKENIDQALETYQEIGNYAGVSASLGALGVIYKNIGLYDEARDCYRQALESFDRIGNRLGVSIVLLNLGVVSRLSGDYQKAISYYNQSLAIKQEVGDMQGESLVLNNLANTTARQGDYNQAETYFRQALRRYRRLGRSREEAMVLSNLGLVYVGAGRYDKALAHCQEALTIARKIEDFKTQTFALVHQGYAYLGQNQSPEALASFEEASAIHEKMRFSLLKMDLLAGLAKVHLLENNLSTALELANQVIELLPNDQTKKIEVPVFIHFVVYQVLEKAGDGRAAGFLEIAYQQLQERIAELETEELRRFFLEEMPLHKEIMEAYQSR